MKLTILIVCIVLIVGIFTLYKCKDSGYDENTLVEGMRGGRGGGGRGGGGRGGGGGGRGGGGGGRGMGRGGGRGMGRGGGRGGMGMGRGGGRPGRWPKQGGKYWRRHRHSHGGGGYGYAYGYPWWWYDPYYYYDLPVVYTPGNTCQGDCIDAYKAAVDDGIEKEKAADILLKCMENC